ncbi:hypothetical protein SAMN05444411_103108 [Lutibacter oricola]|uniref:Uncharacterized protein n=1 Tax=Lutibacter oricola TaxID=762486 RepID=A0A1H2Z1N4_9FLAO|nr:hypothetical protein [Lutibacter oricola]SDX10709.1 hypothetical protein SAMN05444411_103108 [Lutibacter oricola]
MKTPKILVLIICILLFQSCAKEVDFDQIDDASVETSYILTFVNTSFTAPEFLNDLNQEIEYTSDFVQTKVDDSSQDYLEKIELTAIIENSFSRNFIFGLQMFNAAGELIYTLEPVIQILPNSVETTILEIPKEDLHFLYEAEQFGFIFIMPPATNGDVVNAGTPGLLSIKSSLELFFNFREI